MFGPWVLNEIWITDLSSALIGMLMSLSKLFLFSKKNSFKLRWATVIGIVLCGCHQACCLLYYLDEINCGTHVYHFTFEPLNCFRMWLWFRIWTKILVDRRILRKKGTDRRICIPLFTPLKQVTLQKMCKQMNCLQFNWVLMNLNMVIKVTSFFWAFVGAYSIL